MWDGEALSGTFLRRLHEAAAGTAQARVGLTYPVLLYAVSAPSLPRMAGASRRDQSLARWQLLPASFEPGADFPAVREREAWLAGWRAAGRGCSVDPVSELACCRSPAVGLRVQRKPAACTTRCRQRHSLRRGRYLAAESIEIPYAVVVTRCASPALRSVAGIVSAGGLLIVTHETPCATLPKRPGQFAWSTC
jgi:hypothetical protein